MRSRHILSERTLSGSIERRLVALCIGIGLSVIVPTSALAWKEVHSIDGIRVFAESRQNSEFHALKAEALLKGVDAKTAFDVVRDPNMYPKLIEDLKQSKIIGTPSSKCFKLYQRMDAPFPLTDRDYVVNFCHETTRVDGKKVYRLSWKTTDGKEVPPTKGVVRVPVTEGAWELWASDDGKSTVVKYTVFADLGGAVPSALVNEVSARSVPSAVKRLEKLANAAAKK